jgi:hypothetical protein
VFFDTVGDGLLPPAVPVHTMVIDVGRKLAQIETTIFPCVLNGVNNAMSEF